MRHFIAIGSRTPNAAQAASIRKALRSIDPDLHLVIGAVHGCWVVGPEYYGASHYQERRTLAVQAFRKVLP
jgi:hypothetical protein